MFLRSVAFKARKIGITDRVITGLRQKINTCRPYSNKIISRDASLLGPKELICTYQRLLKPVFLLARRIKVIVYVSLKRGISRSGVNLIENRK